MRGYFVYLRYAIEQDIARLEIAADERRVQRVQGHERKAQCAPCASPIVPQVAKLHELVHHVDVRLVGPRNARDDVFKARHELDLGHKQLNGRSTA